MFKSKPLAALVALACAQAAMANQPVTLDEVVVTATRGQDKVRELPVNVSVITAQDIANSTARTVQDVLSGLAGIQIRNSTGAADTAAVDLRGFGMTGMSNTLILVDGVKQNTNDLSAPNLGVVPLGQIERIEVVRGSGAVAYGGGATGGVINIITRNGFRAADGVQATLTAGSYNLKKIDLSGHASSQQVALDAYVKSLTTDNYRQNNAERNDSGGLAAMVRHEGGTLRFYARTANQDTRLPGVRSVDAANGVDEFASNPRGTNKPDDYMSTRTDTWGVQAKQAAGEGMVLLDVASSTKKLQSEDISASYSSKRQQRTEELTASLRYEQDVARHRLVLGVDAMSGDAAVDSVDTSGTGSKKIKQRHAGGFVDVLLRPAQGTSINAGVRSQHVEDSAKVHSGYENSYGSNKELRAWQLGVRQALMPQLDGYAKLGQSFRLANADEQAYVSTPLLPQLSHDKELGLSWQHQGQALRAAWFRYDLNREIHYNQLSSANVNLDPTRRQGVELEGKTPLAANLDLSAAVTWQQATFRSGVANNISLAGKTVPLVPRHMANLSLSWAPYEATRLGLQWQYVGSQRLDNDQANQFAKKLGAYSLINAKLSHDYSKTVGVSLSVNNLLDKQYASYAIRSGSTGATGKYNLYPEAGRNMQAAVTIKY